MSNLLSFVIERSRNSILDTPMENKENNPLEQIKNAQELFDTYKRIDSFKNVFSAGDWVQFNEEAIKCFSLHRFYNTTSGGVFDFSGSPKEWIGLVVLNSGSYKKKEKNIKYMHHLSSLENREAGLYIAFSFNEKIQFIETTSELFCLVEDEPPTKGALYEFSILPMLSSSDISYGEIVCLKPGCQLQNHDDAPIFLIVDYNSTEVSVVVYDSKIKKADYYYFDIFAIQKIKK